MEKPIILTPAEAKLVSDIRGIIRSDAEANGMSEEEWFAAVSEECERKLYGCVLPHEYDPEGDRSLDGLR
jgi:hypothetical protein